MSWPDAVAVGTVLAVAGDRAVDQPGVLLAQTLVADAEPLEHARAGRTRAARRPRAPGASSTSLPALT